MKVYSRSPQKRIVREIFAEVQKTVEIRAAPGVEPLAEVEMTPVKEHSEQKTEVLNLTKEGSSQKGIDKPTPQKGESFEEIVTNVLKT